MHVEIKGTRYASDDGQFIKTAKGNWYSLQSDFKWRKYDMPPRVENRLKVVELNAKATVWKRG